MARAPVTRGTATSGGAVGGGTGASETQVGMWLSTPSEIGRMGQSLRLFIFMISNVRLPHTPLLFSMLSLVFVSHKKKKTQACTPVGWQPRAGSGCVHTP